MMSSCETLSPLPAAGVYSQAPLSFGPSQGPRPWRTPEALTAPILSGMSRPRYAEPRAAAAGGRQAVAAAGRKSGFVFPILSLLKRTRSPQAA
jgi:hypothetical protein